MSAPVHDRPAPDGHLERVVDDVHARLLEHGAHASGRIPRSAVVRAVRTEQPLAPGSVVHAATERILARIEGLGALAPLLADPTVSDVLINGPGPVWIEQHGRLIRTALVLDGDEIARILERILAPLGRRLDRSSPLVDARLADGGRVHAIVAPLAVEGPCVAIRRFGVAARPLAELCPGQLAPFMRSAVRTRRNIVISGGTGAGKTTLLNSLAGEVPEHERLVTIEDVAELDLPHPHVVRLEVRPATGEGLETIGIRQLVRSALRLRPDRIIVGEVRGPEALDMLQAMNTGHEGSLTTMHANGCRDALRRLETMVLLDGAALPISAVRDQIAASVDLVVQIGRWPDGRRCVAAVGEPGAELDERERIPLRLLWAEAGPVAPPDRPPRHTRSEAGDA